MDERSRWRDRITDALLRTVTPDPRRTVEEQAANRIPPLTGAMYPPEKTDYDEFYTGRSRR